MKLTIENLGSVVSVETSAETIDEVIEHIIIPCLLATGYHPDTIKEAFGGEEDD